MGLGAWRLQGVGVAAIGAAALLAVGAAMAATSVAKHVSGFFTIPARQTRTIDVPYPDALKYGNARYSGRAVVLAPKSGAKGRPPNLKKVKILYARSALGGSEYEVRAHNDNSAGTAAVRVEVIATTVEPLPHS
jgi:hypothetical protein